MNKNDYVVFGGLVISLILFLFLTSITSTSQNQAVIENQRLIKNALNQSKLNTDEVLENQKAILNLSNQMTTLILQHQRDDNNAIAILDFLRTNFNESYLISEYLQYAQSNATQKKLDELIALVNNTR